MKQADTAYKSSKYPSIITPHKKPRKSKLNTNPVLTTEQKQENRELGKIRIRVEHVIRELKVFRILSERYRNRRKRFSLRMNLVAGMDITYHNRTISGIIYTCPKYAQD